MENVAALSKVSMVKELHPIAPKRVDSIVNPESHFLQMRSERSKEIKMPYINRRAELNEMKKEMKLFLDYEKHPTAIRMPPLSAKEIIIDAT